MSTGSTSPSAASVVRPRTAPGMWSTPMGRTARCAGRSGCPSPVDGPHLHRGRRGPAQLTARREAVGGRGRRRVRLQRPVRRRLVQGLRLELGQPDRRECGTGADRAPGGARRALGTDFGSDDARWLARYSSDERQVPHYRVGRVFLAGDAAHCHTPAGRAGDEHRDAGCGQPGLEARRRGARVG